MLSDDEIATHRRMAVLEFLQKHIRRREGFSKGLDKGFAKGERNAKTTGLTVAEIEALA